MLWLNAVIPQREHVLVHRPPDSYGSPSHLCSHGPSLVQAQ